MGQIVIFDEKADDYSNVIFFGCHVDSDGLINTVNDNLASYFHSLREMSTEFERIGRMYIKVFEVKCGFFHLIFFLTPSGEIVTLKVNIHPLNGGLEFLYYAHDMYLFQIWANMIVNEAHHAEHERKYYVVARGKKMLLPLQKHS
ncbi:MAG: hypothetical protein NTX05_02150 [Fusobacteria bacterium]|nr:hypothetical protein [Fusobacteriota bacterium]